MTCKVIDYRDLINDYDGLSEPDRFSKLIEWQDNKRDD